MGILIHLLATWGTELPVLVPGLLVACLVSPVPPEGTSNPRPVSGGASRGARGLRAYGLDAERSLGAEGRGAPERMDVRDEATPYP